MLHDVHKRRVERNETWCGSLYGAWLYGYTYTPTKYYVDMQERRRESEAKSKKISGVGG